MLTYAVAALFVPAPLEGLPLVLPEDLMALETQALPKNKNKSDKCIPKIPFIGNRTCFKILNKFHLSSKKLH